MNYIYVRHYETKQKLYLRLLPPTAEGFFEWGEKALATALSDADAKKTRAWFVGAKITLARQDSAVHT